MTTNFVIVRCNLVNLLPFGAGRFINRHLGLKPQAESCSPFGTKSTVPTGQDSNTCPRIRCQITLIEYWAVRRYQRTENSSSLLSSPWTP